MKRFCLALWLLMIALCGSAAAQEAVLALPDGMPERLVIEDAVFYPDWDEVEILDPSVSIMTEEEKRAFYAEKGDDDMFDLSLPAFKMQDGAVTVGIEWSAKAKLSMDVDWTRMRVQSMKMHLEDETTVFVQLEWEEETETDEPPQCTFEKTLMKIPLRNPAFPFVAFTAELAMQATAQGKVGLSYTAGFERDIVSENGNLSVQSAKVSDELHPILEGELSVALKPHLSLTIGYAMADTEPGVWNLPFYQDMAEVGLETGVKASGELKDNLLDNAPVCVDIAVTPYAKLYGKVGFLTLEEKLEKDNKKANGGLYVPLSVEASREWTWEPGEFHMENLMFVPKCTAEGNALCTFMDGDTVLYKMPCVMGRLLEQPPSPQKDGYLFDGWECTDPNGGVYQWQFRLHQVQQNEFVLRARWQPAPVPTPTPTAAPTPTAPPPTPVPGSGSNPSFYTGSGTSGLLENSYPGLRFVPDGSFATASFNPNTAVSGPLWVPASVRMVVGYAEDNTEIIELRPVKGLAFRDALGIVTALHAPSVEVVYESGGDALRTVNLPSATDVRWIHGSSLRYVSLPRITHMDDHVFTNCPSLIEVVAPKLQTVTGNVFAGCTALKKTNYPLLTNVSSSMFYECKALTQVNLPKVRSVENGAFAHCISLQTISLPSVTTMESCFSGCTALKTVELDSLPSIPYNAFYGLPSLRTVNAPKATSIGGNAFMDSGIQTVSLPMVTTVGMQAFLFCDSLTSVSLPSVKTAGEHTFRDCDKLTDVDMPLLTAVPKYMFSECPSLRTISLPAAGSVADQAFRDNANLQSVSMPSVSEIGTQAFQSCTSLSHISMPNLTTVGRFAFASCKSLTSLSLPHAVTLQDFAFTGCTNLRTVSIPVAQELGESVFDGASIQRLDAPMLRTLGLYALTGYTGATEMNLPHISHVAAGAFPPLDSITLGEYLNHIDASALSDVKAITIQSMSAYWEGKLENSDSVIFCHRGSTTDQLYRDGQGPALFYIGEDAVMHFDSDGGSPVADYSGQPMTPVVRPEDPVREGYAFGGWWLMEPSGRRTLWNFDSDVLRAAEMTLTARWVENDWQYENVDGELLSIHGILVHADLPDTVHTMAEGCVGSRLVSLRIPASVTAIRPGAFRYASALQSITVDENSTAYRMIGGALYTADGKTLIFHPGAAQAEELTLPDTLETVQEGAFAYSGGLRTLRFPCELNLTWRDFEGCTGLNFLHGPDDSTHLRELAVLLNAYYNCAELTLALDPARPDTNVSVAVCCGRPLGSESNIAFIMVSNAVDSAQEKRWLAGWSETPGGSAIDLNSWMVKDEPQTLYAVFTDTAFQTEPAEGGVQITACLLRRQSVEIPALIDGMPVAAIAPGAFADVTRQLVGARNSAAERYAQENGLSFAARTQRVLIMDYEAGTQDSFYTEEGALITMPAWRRDGYRLLGWKLENGAAWDFATQTMPAHEITLCPQWQLVEADNPFEWEIRDGGAVILSTLSTQYRLTVPAQLGGVPVTGIAERAFMGDAKLEAITLPDTVTFIGERAFADCARLSSVSLGTGLKRLEAGAFSSCPALAQITLPSGLTFIGQDCFSGCTRLASIHLGAAVESVGSRAFAGCMALASLTVDEANPSLRAQDGLLLAHEGRTLLAFAPAVSRDTLTIPSGVQTVADGALSGGRFRRAALPEGLQTIGSFAFRSCTNLTEITLPDQLQAIGRSAFLGCSALQKVNGFMEVAAIGSNAFTTPGLVFYGRAGSRLIQWALDNGFAVQTTSAEIFPLPVGLKTIGEEAFAGVNARHIVVPDGCTAIASRAFADNPALAYVEVPSSVTSIGSGAFDGCPNVTLLVAQGSAAHRYAQQSGLAFALTD